MMFPLIKEIKSKTGFLHIKRWRIISTPWFSLYLHGIYKEDLEKHLHDHPWNFISFILKGSYIEQLENKEVHRKRFSLAIRKATTFHKIKKLLTPNVYTLVLVNKSNRLWGYKTEYGWIDNISYRKLKREGSI